MILCIFFFLFTVMKFKVVFFLHQAFPTPAIKSSIVLWHNPWSPGECTEVCFISTTTITDPIFCVKEMSKSVLHGSINFLLKGKTCASFTFKQYVSISTMIYRQWI